MYSNGTAAEADGVDGVVGLFGRDAVWNLAEDRS